MHSPTISISGLYERDIDLLLIEEFSTCPEFSQWFAHTALGLDLSSYHCTAAHHSETTLSGESDLEVSLQNSQSHRIRLLIENKIGAALQPRQAERYLERAVDYIDQGKCDTCYTILIAPQKYFGNSTDGKGFQASIAYEAILQWFLEHSKAGSRTAYKIALLTNAIEKGVHGYNPETDTPMTNLWMRYWELTTKHYPELNMNCPARGRTSASDRLSMYPEVMPKNTTIVLRLTGYVDIQIGQLGAHINTLTPVIASLLEPDMQLLKASKSAAIRILVPAIDIRSSDDVLHVALETSNRLLEWYKKHSDTLTPLIIKLREQAQ